MKRIAYHILIPSLLPIAFLAVALTPVAMLGCLTRGLIALGIALISGLAALGTAIKGIKGKGQGDTNTIWFVASTLILVIPVIALLILA